MTKNMPSRSCKEMREGTQQSRILHVCRQKSQQLNPKTRTSEERAYLQRSEAKRETKNKLNEGQR